MKIDLLPSHDLAPFLKNLQYNNTEKKMSTQGTKYKKYGICHFQKHFFPALDGWTSCSFNDGNFVLLPTTLPSICSQNEIIR